jgi:hypothetical protein
MNKNINKVILSKEEKMKYKNGKIITILKEVIENVINLII